MILNKLLYYGRIAPNKGLENALRHFAFLPKDFTFVIVGSGEINYEQSLAALCGNLNVKDRVVFLGSISDLELSNQLAEAEFILLPSLYEGFGLTLVESLAARKKVIAQKNESFIDILTDLNHKEFLFDFTGDTEKLFDKIMSLREKTIDNIDLSKYSFEDIAKIIYNYYTISVKCFHNC